MSPPTSTISPVPDTVPAQCCSDCSRCPCCTTSSTCSTASPVSPRPAFSAAGIYLLLGGLIYLGLWVFGLLIDKGGAINFIPLNSADDWLHFTLGVGMIGLGILLTRGRRTDERALS